MESLLHQQKAFLLPAVLQVYAERFRACIYTLRKSASSAGKKIIT
jgi:hypothetical protein